MIYNVAMSAWLNDKLYTYWGPPLTKGKPACGRQV